MKISVNIIEKFLKSVDKLFPIALSQKQNLHELAIKFYERATICAEIENDEIVSGVFGYTDHAENDMAYISVAATLPKVQGKGYASALITQFIEIAKEKGLFAVHLYAVSTNESAMRMYRKIGFCDFNQNNEQRPEDAHLIYYIRK